MFLFFRSHNFLWFILKFIGVTIIIDMFLFWCGTHCVQEGNKQNPGTILWKCGPDKHYLQAYSPTERLYYINCNLFYTTELDATTFKMRLCQIVSEHHPSSQFKKQTRKTKEHKDACMRNVPYFDTKDLTYGNHSFSHDLRALKI